MSLYTPSHFREQREELLLRIMQEHHFGLVITAEGGEPLISHVPLHVNVANRTVSWHLAVQNPQCAALRAGARATLVFQGPHAYVSPRWYESREAVPTWNFIAIHVHSSGAAETLSAAETAELLGLMTHQYEGEQGLRGYENTAGYTRLQEAIAGFRIPARSLQGKFKLSQNRSLVDQRAVAQQLLASSRESDREVGMIMQELLVTNGNA
jgi:transcriptional regulator